MATKKFSKSEAIKFGWNTMLNNLGFFVGVFIVIFALAISGGMMVKSSGSSQISGMGGMNQHMSPQGTRTLQNNQGYNNTQASGLAQEDNDKITNIIFRIAFNAIRIIIGLGLIRICLKLCNKEDRNFGDLIACYPLIFKYLGGAIIYGAILIFSIWLPAILMVLTVVLSLFLPKISMAAQSSPFASTLNSAMIESGITQGTLTILGPIMLVMMGAWMTYGMMTAIRLQFFSYFIIQYEAGPIDALKSSREITKDAKWDLFTFKLLLGMINMTGALALGVGLLVTIPTTLLANASVYKQLRDNTDNDNSGADKPVNNEFESKLNESGAEDELNLNNSDFIENDESEDFEIDSIEEENDYSEDEFNEKMGT